MRENKDKNTIFPLSPDYSLKKENSKVYFDFMKGALESERIHNIAITGGFGTGKSSLIRSYDQMTCIENQEHQANECAVILPAIRSFLGRIKDCFIRRKDDNTFLTRFLYVSVGEYASDTRTEGHEQGEDITSIRSIERRLLLQIFARFRRADLPQSSFRLVPETWTKRFWLIAILFGVFVFSALLLSFHEQLGTLLVAVNSMEGGTKFGAWLMAFLVKYKTFFRLLLSAYCIGFGGVASALLCIRILPRIRFHEFKVKGANAELSVEREAAESYLDLYCMELVYCLEKIAGKIDHVVVFEDLDRLNPRDCLYILTRLREINNLANLRLQKEGEHICFIYAVNDDFLGTVQHEKFFDYILPVIPEINRRSAALLFADKIKQINGDYDVLNVFPQFETVASYLSDYRLQNTILNEYQVLRNLYITTMPSMVANDDQKNTERKIEKISLKKAKIKHHPIPEKLVTVDKTQTVLRPALNNSQNNEILSFAIYKNCWPEDYHALRENNSRIFTNEGVRCPKRLRHAKHGKILEVLTDNHLLTLHSLYYIGFSEKELSKRYRSRWEANVRFSEKNCDQYLKDLNSFREGDTNCLEEAGLFLINQVNTIKPEEYKSKAVDPFRGLIACVARCNYRENHWFTRRSDDSQNVPFFRLDTWLKLLSILTDRDDEVLKNNFTSLFLAEDRITKTLFCDDNELNTLDLSIPMLKELCRAIPVFPKSVCFCISGVETPNPEKSDAVIQIRDELVFVQ